MLLYVSITPRYVWHCCVLHFNVWPGEIWLFASIYSGYWTGYGRTITLSDQFAAGAGLKARVANMLASGSTFGRLWLDDWWLPKYANRTAYLQQHVGFRRGLSRYFVHGLLQRPVNFTIVSGPQNVSLVPAPELKLNLTLDSLIASMWVSSDGNSIGVMLSNLAEDELSVTASVELERTALTMGAGSRFEVSRLTFVGIDQPLAAVEIGMIRGGPSSQWRIRETLAVGQAVFLRMTSSRIGLKSDDRDQVAVSRRSRPLLSSWAYAGCNKTSSGEGPCSTGEYDVTPNMWNADDYIVMGNDGKERPWQTSKSNHYCIVMYGACRTLGHHSVIASLC